MTPDESFENQHDEFTRIIGRLKQSLEKNKKPLEEMMKRLAAQIEADDARGPQEDLRVVLARIEQMLLGNSALIKDLLRRDPPEVGGA